MTSSCVNLKRARPLLGTFVEISAEGESFSATEQAIHIAFEQIAKVQRLMSFYDSESDVSRLNRAPADAVVQVHRWTWEVLLTAQELENASKGAFNVRIAPVLEEWGYLPRLDGSACSLAENGFTLQLGNQVRISRGMHIDLGGIAKGFAVDRATEALQAAGMSSGVVNCGGDLRVFGEEPHVVHLRHPQGPNQSAGVLQIENMALATSASYFSRKNLGNQTVSPLLDGRTKSPLVDETSTSVIASQCVWADALTKVVAAMGENAVPVLKRYDAVAIVLDGNGAAHQLG